MARNDGFGKESWSQVDLINKGTLLYPSSPLSDILKEERHTFMLIHDDAGELFWSDCSCGWKSEKISKGTDCQILLELSEAHRKEMIGR